MAKECNSKVCKKNGARIGLDLDSMRLAEKKKKGENLGVFFSFLNCTTDAVVYGSSKKFSLRGRNVRTT